MNYNNLQNIVQELNNNTITSLNLSLDIDCELYNNNEEFLNALKNNNSLTSLEIFDFRYNLNELIDIIMNKTNLMYLKISQCFSYYFGINKLIDINKLNDLIKYNTSIIELDLGNNYFEEDFLNSFGQTLKYNSTITKINLNECKISNIDNILEGLENNSTLTSLSLYRNNINNIDNIDKYLNNNSSINYLDLGNNKISNIDNLCNYLKSNSSLTYLNLSENKINNIENLFDAVKSNNTLNYLNLSINKINSSQKNILSHIVFNFNFTLTNLIID